MGIPLATQYKAGLISPRDKVLLDKLGMTPAALDYTPQPLPLFGAWSNYQGTNYGLNVFDSDLQFVAGTNQVSFPGLANSEINTNNPYAVTGTGSGTTGLDSTWVRSTVAVGADGNHVLAAAANGTYAFRAPNLVLDQQAHWGVVIGGAGYRQNFSLGISGTMLAQYARGTYFRRDQLTLSATHCTVRGGGTITTGQRGLVGYNRLTNTLVWVEAAGSNGYRMHISMHPKRKLTGKAGELALFLTEAKAGTNGANYRYIDYAWPVSAADNEGQFRGRIIPCNNGKIALVRMVSGARLEAATITPAASGNSGTFAMLARSDNSTSVPTANTTVGYGGSVATSYYGIRHQVSWDNKWLLAYCPYNSYHAGLAAYMINVDDPALFYWFSFDSNWGMQPVPFGETGFLVGYSQPGSDSGYGMSAKFLDGNSLTQNPNGTAHVARGPLTAQDLNGLIDTVYTGANFPCIVPIERWSMPGFAGHAG